MHHPSVIICEILDIKRLQDNDKIVLTLFDFAAARPLPFDGNNASDSEDDSEDFNDVLLALKSSRGVHDIIHP